MKAHLSLMLLLAAGLPQDASSTSLSCGNKVIRPGDAGGYVRIHCGEPVSIERESRFFTDGGTLGERCFYGSVNIERWRYKRGGGIPVIVTVVEDKVERIRPQTGGFDRGWQSPCR